MIKKFLFYSSLMVFCAAGFVFFAKAETSQIVAQVKADNSLTQNLDIPPESMTPITGLTLKECYQLALKQSEIIAVDAEVIKEAQAHFSQALGQALPHVSYSHSHVWNNSDNNPSLNNAYDGKLAFNQVLFSGFSEFAAMAAGRYEKQQREYEEQRAQQLLFMDVVNAFYLVLQERRDREILETIRKALLDRIEELKTRENLGKSRPSEIASTYVDLRNTDAQIESVRSQELIAVELLKFLIGRPVDNIVEPKIELTIKPEDEYLSKSVYRLDVLAAESAMNVAKKGIDEAKSGFLPSLSVEGDYFNHRGLSSPSDSKWGTSLELSIPIFEGTTTYGLLEQAKAKARESELLFKRTGRLADQDIHDAYINFHSAVRIKTIFRKALASAELNYVLQSRDYQLNLVNNLDVLTAIQSLAQGRRNSLSASYQAKLFYWQLQVSSGQIDLGDK